MRLTFLGTGASEGYPAPFCACSNCQTARWLGGPNLRKRSAALVNDDLLIDLGPDVIAASQIHGVSLLGVQYVLQTHAHTDHLDPNLLAIRLPGWMPIDPPVLHWYGSADVLDAAFRRLSASHAWLNDGVPPDFLEQVRTVFTPVTPGQRFTVGPYRVTSVAANHGGPGEMVQLYVIEAGDRTLFYATDTAPLTESALNVLRGLDRPIDVLALDETMGEGFGADHQNLDSVGAEVTRLREMGVLASNGRVLVHHLSHGNPPHAELAARLAPLGVEVPYDGLVVEV